MERYRNPLSSRYGHGWPFDAPQSEPLPARRTFAAPLQPASYVELHCHSCFSFREGASTPVELVLRARELGYGSLALTDHDNLAGAMQFAQAAKAWELKAITGAEVTLKDGHHLTLLAETPRGYANLSRLLSRANLSSPRGEPRTDFEWLAEHAEGLIALSGCRHGEIATLVEQDEMRQAREAAARYRDVFGNQGYFIELQDNCVYEDQPRNEGLIALAHALCLDVVATNNVHYHVRGRHRLHDLLVAVRHHTNLEAAEPHLRANSEFHLKAPVEMQALFADLPEALANTVRIAERCSFDLTRDLGYEFPGYESGDGRSADEFLHDLCFEKAYEHYRTPLPEQVEIRLRQELNLIRQGKRAGYFLRLWELLDYAHQKDMPARGRGSSVGSMVCFLVGLSGIDPMRYNLTFNRFLNESRLSEDVPDIDIDFGREARAEMFRHIFETYGTAHAAMVAATIEYRYPSAVRDVGKALGLPEAQIDAIAKRMHSRFASSLEEELATMPGFETRLKLPIWRDFITLVDELRGMPRHLSQHSGGVILSTSRLDEQVPVERAAMPDRYISQWDKDSVADAGFVKLDLLGYPSLDQLNRGLRYVRERYGRVIRPKDIDLSDPEVYKMIQDGDVIGTVQIQSRAQIQLLQRIRVSCIEDMIIQVAIIRPGPIQGGAVHPYVARFLGREPVTYDHPSLEPILAETKGVIVFQEQVLEVAMALAGFTAGQGEELRRAMSRKRSREAMEAMRQAFFTGAAAKGVDPQTTTVVYDKILAFSGFGFPRSHAAAMAETAYRVAWLKHYYPAEFYCALFNEQPMGFYSPEVIANDARRHNIDIRGVDVNHSYVECSVEADGAQDAVRLGFRYMKGLGEAAWRQLEEARKEGPYWSLWEFWRRTRLERQAIENLILGGAFAWTGLHERELLWQLGAFYQPLGAQMPLPLRNPDGTPSLRAPDHEERIVRDLWLTGIAVRGRTMDLVAGQLHEGMTPSHLLGRLANWSRVIVGGLVAVRQAPETAKGFVFHTLEDYDGLMNIITAPRLIPKFRHLIEAGPALIIYGRIQVEERSVNVIAERFEELPISSAAKKRMHDFG